ncbi:Phosphoserine phosphatase 1 [Pelotomaculum schinkii]|uniref:Alpha-ribazole phosphatase n=1 Tax=Pelotomaculum schinkii TaxID=78350 RepID=A0A4Y7RCU9_9FIRM|nr:MULTISPECIES: alpha-ribazole phosphatase [Pelotomaculum]TEB06804.1 Phosphoserine phosphatase 1 [Pelotomaculum schinkii]TEB16643.1 Phosphoserine phosphatase 1 [Pelotomaculum sp. FP]
MSCRVYLIRHGETEWNNTMKFQGVTDIPLSERGRRQAVSLGKRLAALKLDAFYASDLVRARETATIISSRHGMSIVTVPALRELNFGAWEGLTIAEIKELFAGEIEQWWENPFSIRIPGGETYNELIERSVNAIKEIIARHSDGRIAVVSHGGPIRSIVGSVLEMDLGKYWRLGLHNGSLSILDFTGWEYGILTLFNDCSHLAGNNAGSSY